MKKKLIAMLLATSLLTSFQSVVASTIDRPECVAPAKPGGGFDITCRIVQTAMVESKIMDKPMQVTFMPGGIGAVAFNMFNTTRTDDPNAIVAFSTGSLLNIATGKFGQFTEDDVRFLATAGTDYGAVIVRADSPYQTLQEVMDALEQDPQSMVIGAGGSVGSQDWLKSALLVKAKGLDPKTMRYVAFDGGGESIAALLGGSIQIYTGDVAEMEAHLESGNMRILAVMSSERLPEPFNTIPTAKEQGFDIEWPIMRGFYMGKDVSDEVYNEWVDLFKRTYATDEFKKNQKDKGLFPLNLAGPEINDDIKKRVERLRETAIDFGLITAQ